MPPPPNRAKRSWWKGSVACERESLRAPAGRRRLSRKKKKTTKKKSLRPQKETQRKSDSASSSCWDGKENGAASERNSTSSFTFSTPFRRFVTIRRKAPVPGVTMKPKREALPPISSDSLCDFKTYESTLKKKRRLCTDVTNIFNSSMDTVHSPIQKTPLLSSTPSVLLTAMPRSQNTFVRQLALCEPLEESVVRFCAETDFPGEVNEKDTSICEDATSRMAQWQSVDILSQKSSITQTSTNKNNKHTLGFRTSNAQTVDKVSENRSGSGVKCVNIKMTNEITTTHRSGSGVKCVGIKMTNGMTSPLRLLPPIMASPSESKSVICVDDLKSDRQDVNDGHSVFSAELFSSGDETAEKNEISPVYQVNLNIKSRHQYNGTSDIAKTDVLQDSPSSLYLRATLPDKWKVFNQKNFQPFVSLNSKIVTEYFLTKNKTASKNFNKNTDDLQRGANDDSSIKPCHIASVDSVVLPRPDMRLDKMQPVVCLKPTSILNSVSKNKRVSGDVHGMDPPSSIHGCARIFSPAFQTKTGTPHIPASVVKNKLQNSCAPQESAGTGRKVCISGFSAQRWGTRRKKTAKTRQELSFQDGRDISLRFKEDRSICGGLSSSLLFSTSLLTSSFMNSTPVKNLNLSTDSLTLRDTQKEHQRWARLRAALSLHRKKKVEAGLPSNYPGDRSDGKISVTSRNSSLLLLSPFQTSLLSEELTDAEKVLAECHQDDPVTFHQCLGQDQLRQCQKVGEGVYGEVFRTLRGEHHVALKVIPIEGSQKINGEHQKSFAEILPEIIISKELSLLGGESENRTSGFITLHSAHCVQGSYPTALLSAWDIYADEKGTENERPDMFGSEQLFMILEFEFGGEDLECMSSKLPSVSVSRSILHQVTAALAVAEQELRFEHRDLHWGNLLLEKSASRTLSGCLHGEEFHIPSAGVQVKIIDYTLSRLDKDGLTVFCDLSTDEELFLGQGDLQFDVYRSIRQENENNWSSYRPHSNVLWLHYLCDKLLSEVQYVKKPTSVLHRRELRKLRDFKRDVQQFSSATEVLQQCKLFK
ncbi:serine/threonine-protein kinase haspin isoform X2 [Pseudophryne corroboree]|uniref:serine/threonine-protein kinase haspin isoform X2 n=1 Tax=Pseudophryne corroboree TaxID=495146 RepID=UPI003081B254